MNPVISVLHKIYNQRFRDLKKSFQNSSPMKYRGILALILVSILSTFFVFAQVQASRSMASEPEKTKIILDPSTTSTPTIIKVSLTPTLTLFPTISPKLSLTPTGVPPTLTLTPIVTKIPTPIKKLTSTPIPTKVPTAQPTSTPFPTITPTPIQTVAENTPFSFSLSPQGSFTPAARGEGNGTFAKPSGFWSFTFSGSFTKLMPNREYQLWLCGTNCSSHTALRFNTNNEGNGAFSFVTITHNQAKDPINRIVVWEASVPGIIHEDENSCVMVSMNHTPCLQTPYFLQ